MFLHLLFSMVIVFSHLVSSPPSFSCITFVMRFVAWLHSELTTSYLHSKRRFKCENLFSLFSVLSSETKEFSGKKYCFSASLFRIYIELQKAPYNLNDISTSNTVIVLYMTFIIFGRKKVFEQVGVNLNQDFPECDYS